MKAWLKRLLVAVIGQGGPAPAHPLPLIGAHVTVNGRRYRVSWTGYEDCGFDDLEATLHLEPDDQGG